MIDFSYDAWPSGAPYDWSPAVAGDNPFDNIDFHVDLGCGTLKKGRIGIDRHAAPGVNIVMDLDPLALLGLPTSPGEDATEGGNLRQLDTELIQVNGKYTRRGAGCLPFDTSSIQSIISHHALEHIGEGFIPLIDEVYRVLQPGGIFRAITPLFPSRTAVEDPDHCRYFMEGTWETFQGQPGPGGHWHEAFSVPYTQARFSIVDKQVTPVTGDVWEQGDSGAREIRIAMRAVK